MTDHDELETYAVGRWPVVVRTLVLLGAPLRHAQVLAVQAVGRLLDRCAKDEWVDLDVVLAAEVVATWEDDRTAWWRRPEQRTDVDLDPTRVLVACARLDTLATADRTRLVVAAVVGLTPDQLDDALGAGPPVPPEQAAGLAHVATEVPLTVPQVGAARRASALERKAGRSRAVAGLAAGLAAVVVALPLGARVLDRTPAPTAPVAVPPPSSRVVEPPPGGRVVRGDVRPADFAPVPWYDGRWVHLPDLRVRVRDAVALAVADDGVVVTDARGRVLLVRGEDGGVEDLGRTDPATPAAADGGVAAWIDRETGTLAVRSLLGGERRTRLPSPSRVVAVDGRRVHVEAGGRSYVVERPNRVSADVPPGVVDAADGALLTRLDGLQMRVTSADGDRSDVTGTDGLLSPDGRHVLVEASDSGSEVYEVVEVGADARLRLPLPDRSVVRDAAFGSSGRVTFVLERPDASPYLGDEDPSPRDEYPGFDLMVCDLDLDVCRTGTRVSTPLVVPLLAR